MSKVLVIYWSGTGNTQAMAEAIAAGAGDATLVAVGDATTAQVQSCEHIAFGCPSMGDEVLEESEFEPFFAEVEGSLGGKNVALFGSYGWGDGQWMRDWQERTRGTGARLVNDEGLILNETPDADGLEQCKQLGQALAAM